MTNEYGYIRVSSQEQNEDRQLLAMLSRRIAPEPLYVDKQSGKDFERPEYKRLIKRLRPGDLLGTFISDLVLQILSFVAQTERENIRRRQAEGIAAASLRGVRFGRPKVPLPENFEAIVSDCDMGKLSVREAQKLSGLTPSTFYRRSRKWRAGRALEG